MENDNKIQTRKKFIAAGIMAGALLTAFRFFIPEKRKKPVAAKEMIRMLTQDGTLVEVEADKIYCGKRKKISDEQLKKWVTKKQSSPQG
jgi:hypothetical protein